MKHYYECFTTHADGSTEPVRSFDNEIEAAQFMMLRPGIRISCWTYDSATNATNECPDGCWSEVNPICCGECGHAFVRANTETETCPKCLHEGEAADFPDLDTCSGWVENPTEPWHDGAVKIERANGGR